VVVALRERIGQLAGVAARKFRLHPGGHRAVGLMADGRLACWELTELPRITHWIQTPHAEMRDLAIDPAGGSIAVASEAGEIELRGWEELSVLRRVPLPGGTGATALDFSPEGRFMAVAGRDERLRLVETATGRVRSTVAAPEWVGCVRFSPDGSRLASACSSQGGGEVRLDRVAESGSLRLLHRLSRSRVDTPAADFVDELISLAFTPDGKGLALFETTWLEAGKPAGWRGNVVMFDAETGDPRWKTPIDGELTGDWSTLAAAGHPHGFFTQLAVVGDEVLCGATAGVLVVLDVSTGERVRRIQLATPESVTGLAFDPQQEALWALLPEGPVQVLQGAGG
jgi:hypothetical protein